MPKIVGNYNCVVAFYQAGQEYDWMANTFRLPEAGVVIDGQTYPTTEHYFQAMKYTGNTQSERNYRHAIIGYSRNMSAFPAYARQMAEAFHLPAPEDWDGAPGLMNGRSHDVMRRAISEKMNQYPQMAAQLDVLPLDAIIVEATANDRRWADGNDGSGTNHLGILYKELKLIRSGVSQVQAGQQAYEEYNAFNATRQGRSLYSFPDAPQPASLAPAVIQLRANGQGRNGDLYFKDDAANISLVIRRNGGHHFTKNRRAIGVLPEYEAQMMAAYQQLMRPQPRRIKHAIELFAEEQVKRLNHWYVWNGRRKANEIKQVLTRIDTQIANNGNSGEEVDYAGLAQQFRLFGALARHRHQFKEGSGKLTECMKKYQRRFPAL